MNVLIYGQEIFFNILTNCKNGRKGLLNLLGSDKNNKTPTELKNISK